MTNFYIKFSQLIFFGFFIFLIINTKLVKASGYFKLAENSNLEVTIGNEVVVPKDDNDNHHHNNNKKNVKKNVETFQVEENNYSPNLVTSKETEVFNDSSNKLSDLSKTNSETSSDFKKDNELKKVEKLNSNFISNNNLIQESKKSNFWRIISIILGTLGIGIFFFVLKSLGVFSAIGLFFTNFLALFRKKQKWGIVFDFETKEPVSNVKIKLFDNQGILKKEMLSNESGFYGFLPKNGIYFLEIESENYKLKKDFLMDDNYGKLYQGELIRINNKSIKSDINLALEKIYF